MNKEKTSLDKGEKGEFTGIEQLQKYKLEIKNEIDDVRNIIYQTNIDFHNYVFPKYINNYKKFLGFVGDRLSSIDGWQSNINYPLVSSAIDTMFANVFDFGYQLGVSEEGLKSACIKAFDFRNTGKNVLGEVAKEALITGKGYAKDYFVKEDFKDTFFGKEISTEIKMPSMQYMSVFDVMYDRSKGIENSSYKIVRTFLNGAKVKTKILPLILSKYSKLEKSMVTKKVDELLNNCKLNYTMRFSAYDYNPVKSLTAVTQWMNSDTNNDYFNLKSVSKKEDLLISAVGGDNTMNMGERSKNYFLNTKDSTYEVVEYTTDTRKYIFINGYIMYWGDNSPVFGKIREVKFSNIPGTGNANGMADKLTGHQDLQNTLWNAFIDNIKLLLGPMFKISGNLPIAKSGKIDFGSFRAYRTNGAADIEKIQLGITDFGPANFMQMNEAAAIKESGMSNYISGGGGSIERVQAGIDLKFNQYKAKLTPLTDGIDQMMGNIIRAWIFMFLKLFTKEELEKRNILVTEKFLVDDLGNEKFETLLINSIDIRDIIDETNISFTYNSLDRETKEAARDNLIKNFQFIAQYMPNKMNTDEFSKVFSGKDFDPLKVFKDATETKKETQENFAGEQYNSNQGYDNKGGYNDYNKSGYNNGGQVSYDDEPDEQESGFDNNLLNQLSQLQ